jgi:hypothetical protein
MLGIFNSTGKVFTGIVFILGLFLGIIFVAFPNISLEAEINQNLSLNRMGFKQKW